MEALFPMPLTKRIEDFIRSAKAFGGQSIQPLDADLRAGLEL
jgi:hypothetical protein